MVASSTPVAVSKRPTRGKGRTRGDGRGAGRRGQLSSGDTGYLSSDNDDLANISTSNWSQEESGREKEVSEEKRQPFSESKLSLT